MMALDTINSLKFTDPGGQKRLRNVVCGESRPGMINPLSGSHGKMLLFEVKGSFQPLKPVASSVASSLSCLRLPSAF